MSENIFRGSWIPVNDSPHPELYKCPFCGEQVYIKRGMATYPTCPFCLSDMPEAEDFDTPEELEKRKAGNRAATGRKYCEDREVNLSQREKRRAYYASRGDHFREYKREYHAKNREKINAQQRARYQKRKDKNREYSKRYYQEHREELIEKNRQWRQQNPERYKEYQRRYRGQLKHEAEGKK